MMLTSLPLGGHSRRWGASVAENQKVQCLT
jgi:hypothetical protein